MTLHRRITSAGLTPTCVSNSRCSVRMLAPDTSASDATRSTEWSALGQPTASGQPYAAPEAAVGPAHEFLKGMLA